MRDDMMNIEEIAESQKIYVPERDGMFNMESAMYPYILETRLGANTIAIGIYDPHKSIDEDSGWMMNGTVKDDHQLKQMVGNLEYVLDQAGDNEDMRIFIASNSFEYKPANEGIIEIEKQKSFRKSIERTVCDHFRFAQKECGWLRGNSTGVLYLDTKEGTFNLVNDYSF